MTNKSNRRLPIKLFVRKAVRIMLTMFSILLACMFILAGGLLILSPEKPAPFVDENGNPLAGIIAEKVFVNINGVEQGMFIREYFDQLEAPVKGFHTLGQSAHSPMFEEPE